MVYLYINTESNYKNDQFINGKHHEMALFVSLVQINSGCPGGCKNKAGSSCACSDRKGFSREDSDIWTYEVVRRGKDNEEILESCKCQCGAPQCNCYKFEDIFYAPHR